MTSTVAPTTDVWVGTFEVHELLAVEPGRISRLLAKDRLPPPYRLKCSPVWRREVIERYRETGGWQRRELPPSPVLGTHEVAEMLGVNKRQVSRWRESPLKNGPSFPEPDHQIAAGPLWERQTILRFARSRRRAAR